MMVYILCVDGSSGSELERERASAMRSERETPNGHKGNCSSDQNYVQDGRQLLYQSLQNICLIISFGFNNYKYFVFI